VWLLAFVERKDLVEVTTLNDLGGTWWKVTFRRVPSWVIGKEACEDMNTLWRRYGIPVLVGGVVFVLVLVGLWWAQTQGYLFSSEADAAAKSDNSEPTTRQEIENEFVRAALEAARRGDVDEALKALDVAIAANPGEAYEAYYYRGLIHAEQGQINTAVEDLTKAIDANPHMAAAYAARGSLYLTLDRPATAIKDFSKAIELDPSHAANYVNRGQAYLSLDMVDLALKDLNHALELDPNSLAAYFNRGVAYFQKRDVDRAIEDFTKCIEIDPAVPAPYFNRAIAYMELNEKDKAAADLAIYLKLAKDDVGRHQAEALLKSLKDPTIMIETTPGH